MTLAAVDVGEGPVAVLLHGQPGGPADWSAVIEELRGRMRLVVPDRPGYGRTGRPALGFDGNATALIQLLDRLNIERAVIAGHSWATGVGLAAAIRFPDRVQALVLAAPVSPALPAGAIDRALAHPTLGPPMTRAGFWFAGLGLSPSHPCAVWPASLLPPPIPTRSPPPPRNGAARQSGRASTRSSGRSSQSCPRSHRTWPRWRHRRRSSTERMTGSPRPRTPASWPDSCPMPPSSPSTAPATCFPCSGPTSSLTPLQTPARSARRHPARVNRLGSAETPPLRR